jgi:hypothetical protein
MKRCTEKGLDVSYVNAILTKWLNFNRKSHNRNSLYIVKGIQLQEHWELTPFGIFCSILFKITFGRRRMCSN